MLKTIFKTVALGTSVGAVVLLLMDQISNKDGTILLGIGLIALSLQAMGDEKAK